MRLTLLLDTNIRLPLEPGSKADIASNSAEAIQLAEVAQQVGARFFLHPVQSTDIENDKDLERRELRHLLSGKYPKLPSPPPVPDRVRDACGSPLVGSNGWVDAQLIAALENDAVSLLVTEDRGIHRACRKLRIDDRCL